MDAQNGGVPLVHEAVGRVGVGLAGVGGLVFVPEGIVVLPVGEPVLLGLRVHSLEVEGAVVGDEALEALVVVAGQVVHAEAAERGTHGTQAVFVYIRQVVGGIVDGHQIVVHALAGPVAAYFLAPLRAEAGQTVAVGGHNHIAVGGHDHEVPAVAPELAYGALRTALAEEQGGVFLVGVEVRGQNHPRQHVVAVGGLHPAALHGGLGQLVE